MIDVKISAFADEASPEISEQIVALKRNNLYGLEVRNVDGVNVSEITVDKAIEVRKKLDHANLAVWSIGSPIGKIDIENDDFASHTEKFKHTLKIAEILGAKNIRIFSFFIPKGKKHEVYKNEVIDRLGMFCDISKDYDINLCHENEKGIYGDVAERCSDIHKAIPSIKAVFDPANFVQCNEDTLFAWERLKDYVHYMHIKDALSDGSVVPAGLGDGNIRFIADSFIKSGGRNFTLEPHLAVFKGLSGLEKEENTSDIGKRYIYKNNDEAFDAACRAFGKVLADIK